MLCFSYKYFCINRAILGTLDLSITSNIVVYLMNFKRP